MHYVTNAKLGDLNLDLTTASVRNAISQLPELTRDDPTTGISLCGPNDAYMGVAFTKGLGYYVSVTTENEQEQLVIDTTLPKIAVHATIGGQSNPEYRCVLVSKEIALEAVQCFFETGTRSPKLSWRSASEYGNAQSDKLEQSGN